MKRWRRHILMNVIIIAMGWVSLRWGWGIRPQRWGVLIPYILITAAIVAPLQAWVMRAPAETATRPGAE